MYFVAQYRARKDRAALRSAHQAAHVEFRKGFGNRPLLSAEGGDPAGSLFVFAADGPAEAADLANRDPLCLHGVYELVSVAPFKPMAFNPPVEP